MNNSKRKIAFIAGLLFNISLLAYFKYTDFLIATANDILSTNFTLLHIILPIGISFYTFQQIAYLSDIYTKKHVATEQGFLHYGLFISFFPQLIAGPIVHHKEMMPQFANRENQQIKWDNIYWGLVLLACGLFKKVLIADNISPIVAESFDIRESLTFMEALFGSLAYTLQLYFDFSGYSDMAVGIGLFFNIHLPFNFFSPYKAQNIQDFWRRWHITLSRWLREYLYIPLGGNRSGSGRTLANLFLTFLVGGIWHGAAWTFVAWGALHGLAVVVHRLWTKSGRALHVVPAVILTFLFVNFTWIFFRAPDFDRVGVFLDAFLGQNGFWLHRDFMRVVNYKGLITVIVSFIACFTLQSSKEFYEKKEPSCYLSIGITSIFLAILYYLFSLWCFYPEIEPDFIYFQF
ncbi:MAG: MBOAT family O-acyltransferase [Eubacteriales bacterium]